MNFFKNPTKKPRVSNMIKDFIKNKAARCAVKQLAERSKKKGIKVSPGLNLSESFKKDIKSMNWNTIQNQLLESTAIV